MAENTLQYEWIVKLKTNLEHLFRHESEVFIAADLLWYPIEGRPDIRRAPDVMVVFGRPKGHRGSYLQWQEDNLAPQVVIEVLSPGNRPMEMSRKQLFYHRYGVEEYCMIEPDPAAPGVMAWQRVNDVLTPVEIDTHWESPRLGIKIGIENDELVVRDPKGEIFQTAEAIRAQNEELLAQNQAQAEEIARLREELAQQKKE